MCHKRITINSFIYPKNSFYVILTTTCCFNRLYEMGVKPVKTIIVVLIIIISFICLEFFIPVPPMECNFANTVNITAGHRYPNGSYGFENVIYNEGFYKDYDFIIDENHEKVTVENHIRGCLCAVKSCIRICKNYNDHHHVKVFNEDEEEHDINLNNNTDYHIMTQRPCAAMYALDDKEDKWIFYKASIPITR